MVQQDTGTAYADRVSNNGGADGTSTSRPDIEVSAGWKY
jgi:hypothetical protein